MKPLSHLNLPTRADFLATSDATRTIEVLRKKAGVYAEALRAIGAGELTRGKAIERANVALEKGKLYG